jgi:hypothetical protein
LLLVCVQCFFSFVFSSFVVFLPHHLQAS